MDCGHSPIELEHHAEDRHTYAEYRVFGSLSLILCNFCQVDFGSYDPTYFGLPKSARIGFEYMEFVRNYETFDKTFDKVCPVCVRRLSFLQFIASAHELHQSPTD